MNSTEQWTGQNPSSVQQQYGNRISVANYETNSAEEAFNLTVDAWEKGIAYCYVNNNEYQTPATWFEEYVAMLREYSEDIKSYPVVMNNMYSFSCLWLTFHPCSLFNKAFVLRYPYIPYLIAMSIISSVNRFHL